MIAILDSDLGGLGFARAIIGRWPETDLVYYADTARAPYSGKSPETVHRFAQEGIRRLTEWGAGLIVVACPSAASALVGAGSASAGAPLCHPLEAIAASALAATRTGRIGLLASAVCRHSGVIESLIRSRSPSARIWSRDASLITSLVELDWLRRPESRRIIKKQLHPLKLRQIDTLIPALAPHPSLLRLLARKAGRRVAIVDPVACLLHAVEAALSSLHGSSGHRNRSGDHRFLVSDPGIGLEKIARTYYRGNITLTAAPV